MKYALREITPREQNNLFYAINYPKNRMEFPLHFHDEFELSLALNAKGKRITGNRVEPFMEKDLILIGPNVLHCYKQEEVSASHECEISIIQFDKKMYQLPIFSTNQLLHIKDMFMMAMRGGVVFPETTINLITPKLSCLIETEGFDEVLLFFEILNDLACSEKRYIDVTSQNQDTSIIALKNQSRRINKILNFIEMNYFNKITLNDISSLIGMSPSAASRFFKTKTKNNFNDYLTNYRIGRVAQMLTETEKYISEICYNCGFNNISNFNKAFKKETKCTPNEYRIKFKSSIVPKSDIY